MTHLRVWLLELPHRSPPIPTEQVRWLNARSRVCTAVASAEPVPADVVWVLSQDPLGEAGRRAARDAIARGPRDLVEINPPEVYDAYHRDDAFPRLAAAGVSVPRTSFGPRDEGVTPVVYKARDEQPSSKFLAPWRGEVPGYRAFAYEDGRDEHGRSWRYRAYYVLGDVLSGDAVASDAWEAKAEGRVAVDVAAELRPFEREQIARLAEALGLDFFAVDYLRRAADGVPVFLDVNVFPMVTIAEEVTRARGLEGAWHVWEVADRFGRPDPDRSHWQRFDDALVRHVERWRRDHP